MATPAAVLSILVRTQGAQAAAAQLGSLDKSGRAAAGGLSKVETNAKRSSKSFSMVGSAAKSAGVLLGAAGLAKGISSAVSEYREAQKTGAQTTAVLKSTGSAAKVTAKNVQDLAGAISRKTGIDDEQIQASENMLLTFTRVRNETGKGNKIFNQATQVVTDMSAALGQSGKSSAIQLGKALQDPVKGITALRRVGVAFTKEQQNQINAMVKSGDTLGAQKMILRELTKEFGGSAAAQATAGDKFKVALGNFAEAAGAVLVPALDKVMQFFTRLMTQMVQGVGVGGALISKFREFGGALAPLGQSIALIVSWLGKHQEVTKVLAIGLGVLTGAIIAVNLAMSANPFVLAAVAIAALVVGVVTAYREFATFRSVVNTVVGVVGAVGGALGVAASAVAGAFSAIVGAVHGAMTSVITEIHKWDLAVTVIRTAVAVIGAVLRPAFTVWLAVVRAGMALLVAGFRVAWEVVKAVFRGAITILSGILRGAGQIFSGAVKVIEGVLRGDFGRIWDGIKTIFRGAMTILKGIITGAAKALGGAASAVGNAIKDAFTSALGKAAGVVVGFVNGVIDIINKIPGVNIGHVGLPQSLQSASKAVGNTAQGQTHGLARGGAFGLTGGKVNAPMVMMGEEAPRHPEFVIPTNPAYRKRAQGLLAQAAGTIGGMAKGGVLGAVGGALSDVGGAIVGGAKSLLGKLPGVGDLPGWLKGTGKYVLGKAASFIKDKVTDILPGGGGGGDQATSTQGLVPRVLAALAFARAHGWTGTVTSGFRSDADQLRIWNSGIRPAAKPKSLGGPGSNHSLGQAVDVTDIPGFARAMAMMPADKRLYSRVPNDPVHFSVTGNKRGGILGLKKGGVLGGNVKAVWQFLIGKGFTPVQAAGVIGVMQGESFKSLSTTATNPTSGAYGIAQWLGGRKAALMAKKNPSSLQTQLEHLWAELQGSESAAFQRIKGAHSIDEAVSAWLFGFERPGKGEANLPGRTANARNVFSALKGVGAGGGGGTATSGAASAAAKVSPFDQAIASADVDIADTQAGKAFGMTFGSRPVTGAPAQAAALTAKRKLIGARIRKIRADLESGKIKNPATRLARTQELSGLLAQHAELGTQVRDLRSPFGTEGPPTAADFLTMRTAQAALTPGLADDLTAAQQTVAAATGAYQKAVGTGDPRKISEAADALKSASDNLNSVSTAMNDAVIKGQFDWADAAIALAGLTAGLDDDRAALEQKRQLDEEMLNQAMATNDPVAIAQYANALKSDRDAIESLDQTLKDQQAAMEAHTAALQAATEELRKQNQFAVDVRTIQMGELAKGLADFISGQIGGYGGAGARALTAGAGTVVRY